FIQLASAIGAPVGGWLADRLSRSHAGGRIMVQALGLSSGAIFIFLTAHARAVGALMLWMTIFGFCKGLYDSNIFAALYYVVHQSIRATAAGIMNAVGWTGGAMAPATIGWILSRGGADHEIDNMSNAIAFGGAIYFVGAGLLILTIVFLLKRNIGR